MSQLAIHSDPSAVGHVRELAVDQLAVSVAVACIPWDELPSSVLVVTVFVWVTSDSNEVKSSSRRAENQLGTDSTTVNMLDLRLVIIQGITLTL